MRFNSLDDNLMWWLLDEGQGKSWGIYLCSQAELTALHHHLFCLLSVRNLEGEKPYFRYYDPWVLRKFLPSCSRRQLRTFFGAYREGLDESARDASVWARRRGKPDLISAFYVEDDNMQLARLTADEPGELPPEVLDEAQALRSEEIRG